MGARQLNPPYKITKHLALRLSAQLANSYHVPYSAMAISDMPQEIKSYGKQVPTRGYY